MVIGVMGRMFWVLGVLYMMSQIGYVSRGEVGCGLVSFFYIVPLCVIFAT